MKRVARVEPSAVWTVHTAIGPSRLRSTVQIFVCTCVVICSSTFAGLLNFLSTGVCNHHSLPCRTN
jgi:hypothetical protein